MRPKSAHCNVFALLLFGVALLVAPSARAEIRITSPLLGNGAIVQRNEPVAVEGKAAPGAAISATFAGQQQSTTAAQDGSWRLVFAALSAGGPFELELHAGSEREVLTDLFVGDVWVCSGQSNMEWPLRNTIGAEAEIAKANHPTLRQFEVPRSWAAHPESTLAGGSWVRSSTQTAGSFTGVGYYFGKELQAETQIPIGLINTNWGGSAIEAWMSPEALKKSPRETARAIEQLVARAERETEAARKQLARFSGALVEEMQPATGDFRSAPEEDDASWLTLQAPALWEEQGFGGMDGVVWYQKQFQLTPAEAASGIVLGLGRIDDNDTTWVNGNEVGSTHAYDKIRRYPVAASVLRPGKNTISIRVEDTGGGGGLYSDEALLYVETSEGKRRSLAGSWQARPDKVTLRVSAGMNHIETALYNKMIHPLLGTPIKGVIWYQGESNAGSAEQAQHYASQFQALIQTWRSAWRKPQLPFYWVQLASFESGWDTPRASPWAILRHSQTAALALPHTGQAITLDVGNARDIHPRDKQTVGHRLARIALHDAYGRKAVHYRGPVFREARIEGKRVRVRFTSPKGLIARSGRLRVSGFELGRADGSFSPADGVAFRDNSVLIPFRGEPPQRVRYAWDDNPEGADLQDRSGLPAEPFQAPVIH